jgi:hypothetical protein
METIRRCLEEFKIRNKDKSYTPLIADWITRPSMQSYLIQFESIAKDLYSKEGGRSKIKDWIMTDDQQFYSTTAELFLIKYLKLRKNSIENNLVNSGPDAIYNNIGDEIGIEIKTLNDLTPLWIFRERFTNEVKKGNVKIDSYLRIYVKPREARSYLNNFNEIIKLFNDRDYETLRATYHFDCELEPESYSEDVIWKEIEIDQIDWFSLLTRKVFSIINEKGAQLTKFKRNVVFVCLNNIIDNWALPGTFDELSSGGISYIPQIDAITSYWKENLSHHDNIIGVSYFYFDLNNLVHYTPLHIFWHDDGMKIKINL